MQLNLSKIENLIKNSALSQEEKEELWKIVDEIIHHRIMGCVLDNLPNEHHEEFLTKFEKKYFDSEAINYLEEKCGLEITDKMKSTLSEVEEEILSEIKS